MYNDTESRRNIPADVARELKKRSTWWNVMTYLEPTEFVFALNKATHWAYAYHDKDEGEPHYHIVLHYDNARTGFACLSDFVGEQNSMAEKCSSPQGSYEYLTHANEVGKYIYDESIIVCHNPIYWNHFIPSVRDRTQTDFLEDLLDVDNEIDIVYMAKKYGRDFIKNYKAYMDFRYEVMIRKRFN